MFIGAHTVKSKLLMGLTCLLIGGAAQAQQFRYNYTLSSNVPYDWQSTDPTYTNWENVGDIHSCSNWSPSIATYGKGTAFTQTATDCKQDQQRYIQERQQDSRTGIYQNIGNPVAELRSIDQTQSRAAVGILENWSAIDPTYTNWVDTNALYGCTSWSPDPSSYSSTASFTQSTSTCKTDQEREKQNREEEKYTSEVRDSGSPEKEKQTLPSQSASRQYSVLIGQWQNVGEPYGCINWSPDTNTVGKAVPFTQTASDCKLDQSRKRTESYTDHKTGSKINVPKANEVQVLPAQKDTRDALGTREDWASTDSIYGAWTSTAGKIQYGCTTWTPSPASKTSAGSFVQTSTDCKTDQTRTRQDQEKENNTQEVRKKGDLVTEQQTLTSQSANRNYTVAFSAWANNGAITGCSNWSPAPSTVTTGKAFTQTATDCSQAQTRTRSESYVDHLSGTSVAAGSSVQNQSIAATETRAATGTLETWATSTPAYSAWTNSSDVYGCTAWSPSPSNYTDRTQFNQTGTGCSVNQTRSRQDQQVETTTRAIRNNGAAVTESQTVGGQSSTRTYLMDFNPWADSGSYYGCTAWTPDASTIASGTAFTQSANCSINQGRGAAGYTLVNGGWSPDPAVPLRNESQVITRAVTQDATGTKVMAECPGMSSSYSFIHESNRNVDHIVAYWGKKFIGYSNTGKYGTLKVSSGGYVYYNDNVTTNALRAGSSAAICRRPA